MSNIKFHDESGSLRVVNMDTVIEARFVHRNENVREEIVLRHLNNQETRLPKSQRANVARSLDLSPDDFLSPSEKAERARLLAEAGQVPGGLTRVLP